MVAKIASRSFAPVQIIRVRLLDLEAEPGVLRGGSVARRERQRALVSYARQQDAHNTGSGQPEHR
jgi:hypothetical protein